MERITALEHFEHVQVVISLLWRTTEYHNKKRSQPFTKSLL